jgi:hypothetical protein
MNKLNSMSSSSRRKRTELCINPHSLSQCRYVTAVFKTLTSYILNGIVFQREAMTPHMNREHRTRWHNTYDEFTTSVVLDLGYAKTSYGVCKIEKINILFRDKH